MIRLILLCLLVMFAGLVRAAPFVVADVVAGVSSCGTVLDGGAKVNVVVATGTTQCKFDLVGIAAGSHTVTMTAIAVNDPVWGSQETAPSLPFTFTKPAAPVVPSGLRLSP